MSVPTHTNGAQMQNSMLLNAFDYGDTTLHYVSTREISNLEILVIFCNRVGLRIQIGTWRRNDKIHFLEQFISIISLLY